MVSLPVYDRTGAEVGTYEIDPAELAPRISKQLLHDVVVMYQTNRRQGSAKTKTRSEVSRHDEEDVPAEGHGQRPGRLAPQRRPPRRRAHPRQAAAGLVVPAAEEGGPAGHADGRGLAHCRRRDHADRRSGVRAAEDPGDGGRSEGAESRRPALLVAVPGYDVNVYKSIRNLADVPVLPVAELNALDVLTPGGC